MLSGLERFTHPVGDSAAIGRIHENNVPAPILGETIFLNCEEAFTLGIGCCGAGIEREAELGVEPVE